MWFRTVIGSPIILAKDELEHVGVERPDSKDVLSSGSVSPSSSTPPPVPVELVPSPSTNHTLKPAVRECKELPSEIARTRSSLAISSTACQSCSPPPTHSDIARASGPHIRTPEVNERIPRPSAIQSQLIDSHDDVEHSIPATLIRDPTTGLPAPTQPR
uniref:Uncharacterized protein n=1 Tax=Anopheles maculatus TaxID=74869 RepID=A0A182SD63_9DIPT